MKSSEIVRGFLRNLASEFPTVRLRYQFDQLAETHMVEVSPAYLYDADDNFKGAQAKVIDEFIRQFPDQGICFIGPNDVVGIEGEADVFHGFWSEVQVSERLSFSWPVGFVPVSFPTPPTNWMDAFSVNPNDSEIQNPVFIQGSTAQSFVLPFPLVSFERYDVAVTDSSKGGHPSEDSDYALAA